jgi:hypothetical protein
VSLGEYGIHAGGKLRLGGRSRGCRWELFSPERRSGRMEIAGHADELPIGPRFSCAVEIPFASFENKYAGRSCYVVGRGPTEFNYEELAEVDEPIFFVNDAVCLEKYARSETYFFAHDAVMRVWLDGKIKSTAVLPMQGDFLRDTAGMTLQHGGNVVFYHSHGKNGGQLLLMSRHQIAELQQLYMHSGTIHSVIHFIWFCGFRRVVFIGCDCMNDGYDPRLENLSKSTSCRNYTAIGKAQGLLISLLGLNAIYLGTPGRKSEGGGMSGL